MNLEIKIHFLSSSSFCILALYLSTYINRGGGTGRSKFTNMPKNLENGSDGGSSTYIYVPLLSIGTAALSRTMVPRQIRT